MLICFELYVRSTFDPEELITAETRKETGAKLMTREEAEQAGLGGLPEPQTDHGEVRYVLVNGNERRWLERAIEANADINAFNVHEVGG